MGYGSGNENSGRKARNRLTLAVPPKPETRVVQSEAEAMQFARSEADERAVRAGYRMNEALADHYVDWCRRHLQFTDGVWAGNEVEFSEWQLSELVRPIFGWVGPDGRRRIRQTYIELPKKNGKSTWAATVGLYGLLGDGEPGAEVYSLGADKDQARVVHREAITMCEESGFAPMYCDINRTTGEIRFGQTNSFYRALSATPRGKHGIKAHFAIADELHEWWGTKLWDAIKYAMLNRAQPLLLVITNAGEDRETVCFRQRELAQRVLKGEVTNHRLLAVLCTADEKDAKAEVESIREGATEIPVAEAVNPGLQDGILRADDFIADVHDACETPTEMANFLRLRYGVWVEGAAADWLGPLWADNYDNYDEQDLLSCECHGGLDLGRTKDMTAFVLQFEQDGTYRQLPYYFLPESRANELRKHIPTMEWMNDGHLIVTPGSVCDFDIVHETIGELSEKFDILSFAFDRKEAEEVTQRIEGDFGIERIDFSQTLSNYNLPTKEYERLLTKKQMLHNGHPILRWQAAHVIAYQHPKTGYVMPRKPSDTAGDYRTIDGVQASIMALSESLTAVDAGEAYFG